MNIGSPVAGQVCSSMREVAKLWPSQLGIYVCNVFVLACYLILNLVSFGSRPSEIRSREGELGPVPATPRSPAAPKAQWQTAETPCLAALPSAGGGGGWTMEVGPRATRPTIRFRHRYKSACRMRCMRLPSSCPTSVSTMHFFTRKSQIKCRSLNLNLLCTDTK